MGKANEVRKFLIRLCLLVVVLSRLVQCLVVVPCLVYYLLSHVFLVVSSLLCLLSCLVSCVSHVLYFFIDTTLTL